MTREEIKESLLRARNVRQDNVIEEELDILITRAMLLAKEAFEAGFSISAEGFNGEYPFNDSKSLIEEGLQSTINKWLSEKFNQEKKNNGIY